MMDVSQQSTGIRFDDAGVARVGPSRVTLDSVIHDYHHGSSPEEIVSHFPALDLRDVYAAVAYYLGHRDEVDAYLRGRQREAEAVEAELRSNPGNALLRERILARRTGRGQP